MSILIKYKLEGVEPASKVSLAMTPGASLKYPLVVHIPELRARFHRSMCLLLRDNIEWQITSLNEPHLKRQARGVHCTKHVRVYVNAQKGY